MNGSTGRTRKYFYVYILASLSGTLYVGLTDDLPLRIWQHRNGKYDGFTKKYKVDRLMFYETLTDPLEARRRELQLKRLKREKKIALFELSNPGWKDLSKDLWSVKKASGARRS